MPGLCTVPSSLLGPVDLLFRAPSGRLEFTVRRHKFNNGSPLCTEERREVRNDKWLVRSTREKLY